jgi:hypothetical protein
VEGWFTSDIRRDPNWSFLRVTGPDGSRVDTGETQLGSNRRSMSVDLRAGLGPGRYIVTWRTFDDADGEIFGDCYTFFIGQAAADAAVSENLRLDAGSACQRIEFDAGDGTPRPDFTPSPPNSGGAAANDSDDAGVPVWLMILGVAAGLAVGLVGGRMVGGRN